MDFRRTSWIPTSLAAVVTGMLTLPATAQVVIPETFALPSSAADKSKPGFIWNMFQNGANQENNNQKTENALAGRLKDADGNLLVNEADPNVTGPASGPGVKLGSADNAPIQFIIPEVINFSQAEGENNGNIRPDLQMPGIPGLSGSTDGIAAEVLTYLDLPAGEHTLIVNSDDGFLLTMGGAAPSDQFGTFVGQFNGGRGASDTAMTIKVTKAGLYATRLTWEEGGGGANIELVQVLPSGRVAVNSADSTIKAYRAVTGSSPVYAQLVTPQPGSRTAPFDTALEIDLVGASVDVNSVRLTFDGALVGATVSKAGEVTSVRFQPAGRLAPLSKHSVSLAFDAGGAQTRAWDFTVVGYANLTPDLKVTPNTGSPGFLWRVHQNEAFQANDNVRPIQQLAGQLGVNKANPDAVGAAKGPGKPGANDRMPIEFEIETVINLDQAAGGNGDFQPDEQMPGIPGTSENTDGIAAEIITYLELPAGVHTLIVNSDDGFVTFAGNITDVLDAQNAGEFSGGRGATDTAYRVVVAEAGVYPFRTVWEEGGGGANIEWKIVKADGTRALLNDSANGGPKAYRAITSAPLTAITSVSPLPGQVQTAPDATLSVTIVEGSTPVDQASIKLSLDGADVAATVTKSGSTYTVVFDPATDFKPDSTHKAAITFTHGGVTRSEEWSFIVPPLTRDTVAGRTGFLIGAKYSADGGGRSGQPGDYALDTGTGSGVVNVADATFFNPATGDDTLTIAYHQKLRQVQNSSGFWANSPSSNNGTRGFQAHTPWGDQTIYFDTSGCCTADGQRINKNISELSGGDPVWWQDWHHFAFVKNVAVKQIWIDGVLFHEGGGDPLPTDFTNLIIGGGPGVADNRMAGWLDDFVVYNAALSEAQLKALASGTKPNVVTGNPGLLAHWDFNDAPKTGGEDRLTVTRVGAAVSIAYATGTTLQTAPSITGPWADVAGAANPHTVGAPGGAGAFFRTRR